MLMRDEELLIREHLPGWLRIAWCALGAVDERTRDHSARAFLEAAGAAPTVRSRRFVYQYTFNGLGTARTDLLREAASRFSALTHILYVDPDWKPLSLDLGPLLKVTQEAQQSNVFVFRIQDRNGRTERLLDWCFRYSPTARFRFRWHEELVLTPYQPALLPWVVQEVLNNQSWHAETNGGPATAKRYQFEISLLEQDLTDLGHSTTITEQKSGDASMAQARLRYYLGVDYLRLAILLSEETHFQKDDKNDFIQRSLEHLDAHIGLIGGTNAGGTGHEMAYVARLHRAAALRHIGRSDQAEMALLDAIRYDDKRAEAYNQIAELYLAISRPDSALQAATTAANLEIPVRLFYHHPAAYGCEALRLALRALRAKGESIQTSEYYQRYSSELHCNRETPILQIPLPDQCSSESKSQLANALRLYLNDPDEGIRALRSADNEAQCCGPQRAFSRLFLGEAPDAARLKKSDPRKQKQFIAALELGLQNEAPGTDWRIQYTYALAAMRHHLTNNTTAAGEILVTELGLLPHGIATKGRRMPAPSLSEVRVAAVASRDTPALQNLRDSASAAGIDLHVLGVNDPSSEPYTGHEIKLRLLAQWLKEQAVTGDLDRLVLLVDAFDVLLWPALNTTFRERFLRLDADVVLGGDPVPYPDAGMTKLYQDYGLLALENGLDEERKKPYVNSGTIAGTVRSLLAVFQLIFSFGTITSCGPDDQRAFHRAYLLSKNSQRLPSMHIDAQGSLFHCLHRDLRALTIKGGQLFISEGADEEEPCVTHGNAGDGKEMYTAIVQAWRTSETENHHQLVEPPLFMRGLELWRRGRQEEAEASWLHYLKFHAHDCSASHAVDLRYNLGVVLHQRKEMEAALNYYDAALQCDPNHINALSNSGIVLAALNNLSFAIDRLQKAFALAPDNQNIRSNLANVQRRSSAQQASSSVATQTYEALQSEAVQRSDRNAAHDARRQHVVDDTNVHDVDFYNALFV